MLRFLVPGFLAAGAVAALVPLALHMLARTPPERRPLPTARFLRPDRRTRLRLRPPADRLLLVLRMLLLVLLGAGFARPEWLPEPSGTRAIVLLDAGAAMAPVWEAAVAAAGARMEPGDALVVFDTVPRVHHAAGAAVLDSIRAAGPGSAPSSYLAAMRGLREAAATLPAESARAALVTRPRWGAWSPAVPRVRAAAWPAALEVVDAGTGIVAGPEAGPVAGPEEPPARGATAAIAAPSDHPLRLHVHAALEALGFAVAHVGDEPADVVVTLGDAPKPQGSGPRFTLGAASPAADVWAGTRSPAAAAGRIVLPDGRSLDGWRRLPGEPGSDAAVVAVWDDGRPAAAVLAGDGCRGHVAAEPAAPAAAADPAFPWLLAALVGACDTVGGGGAAAPGRAGGEAGAELPLDSGARSSLSRGDLPAAAALAAPGGASGATPGRSLFRVALGLALAVAVAEAVVAYARRRSA